MNAINQDLPSVSVIGLGMMGSTLARLLLRNGYRVTVWNRTTGRANPLIQEGAVLAPDVASAVKAGSIVVVCVYDYKASDAILNTPNVGQALKGRLLVQLTTGSPKEAGESEAWVHSQGAEYLDGAIQAAPSQMGRPDTPILVSGNKIAFERGRQVLAVFGGNVAYLGESIEAASAMDLATLSYIYGSVLGFMHGARIAETSGIQLAAYGDLVAGIAPTFADFLKHESLAIQNDDFTVSESPLKISVEATQRILQQARDGNLNTEIPELAARLFKRAADAGYGDEEAAALIKVLRQEAHTDAT